MDFRGNEMKLAVDNISKSIVRPNAGKWPSRSSHFLFYSPCRIGFVVRVVIYSLDASAHITYHNLPLHIFPLKQ